MLLAMYNQQPDNLTYMALPNGEADVWMRKDVHEVEQEYDGEKLKAWECKEVYFHTTLSKAEVEADFEKLWNVNAYPAPTTEERIDALENALMEIMEVL